MPVYLSFPYPKSRDVEESCVYHAGVVVPFKYKQPAGGPPHHSYAVPHTGWYLKIGNFRKPAILKIFHLKYYFLESGKYFRILKDSIFKLNISENSRFSENSFFWRKPDKRLRACTHFMR